MDKIFFKYQMFKAKNCTLGFWQRNNLKRDEW